MKLVGVTGTNGKTTTCELTYQLLNALNKRVGLISTVSVKFSHNRFDTGYHVATPDSLAPHKILYEMYKSGCELVLLTRKRHEKSMCFETVEIPWSDRKEVIRALRKSTK